MPSGSTLTLLPAFDSSQDAFWVCLPDEGLGFVVVLGEIVVDGGLEVDDRAEHPTLEPSLGEEVSVRLTTRPTVSPGSGRLPGGRVLSRRRPSTPSCMNRSCQRQTTGFDRPERRTISSVPQSSAVARITRARAESF